MTTQEKISNIEILEKIKQYRNQKNLSQAQVAAVIGISQPAYAKVESGITENISLNIAKGIAKALGENFNELFEINADNKNLDIQTDEIEELKGKIKELQDRIEEKDFLIKSISAQTRHTKEVLIHEVYLAYTRKIRKINEKLKNSNNDKEIKDLTNEKTIVELLTNRQHKKYMIAGIYDQQYYEDNIDRIAKEIDDILDDPQYLD